MKTQYVTAIYDDENEEITVGVFSEGREPSPGEWVTVELPDENGNPIKRTGFCAEILEVIDDNY